MPAVVIPLLAFGAAYAIIRRSTAATPDEPPITSTGDAAPEPEPGMPSLESSHLVWPVSVLDDNGNPVGRGTSRITQEYNPPHHMGVDISVPGHYQDARAVIVAVAPGTVARAYEYERGWAVLLNHGDWASGYLHMTELRDDIIVGAYVSAGQELGTMGADPLDAEHIVHLHIQLAPNGNPVDPAPYLTGAT